MELNRLPQTLDEIRKENGIEYWFARELYPLLGYKRWENFQKVIEKAKKSCATAGNIVADHFRDITKMIKIATGTQKETSREIEDLKLTRYACYLIAQNGNPRIPEIALSQMYFANQTRKQELLEQYTEDTERLTARGKLAETEKEFSKTLYERNVDGIGISIIRAAGDSALFGGKTTAEMKKKLGVNAGPLADVLPTVTLKAKDLAAEMTIVKTKQNANLKGTTPLKNEHERNNQGIRKALTDAHIYPELLPPSESIKKIENKYKKLGNSAINMIEKKK